MQNFSCRGAGSKELVHEFMQTFNAAFEAQEQLDLIDAYFERILPTVGMSARGIAA